LRQWPPRPAAPTTVGSPTVVRIWVACDHGKRHVRAFCRSDHPPGCALTLGDVGLGGWREAQRSGAGLRQGMRRIDLVRNCRGCKVMTSEERGRRRATRRRCRIDFATTVTPPDRPASGLVCSKARATQTAPLLYGPSSGTGHQPTGRIRAGSNADKVMSDLVAITSSRARRAIAVAMSRTVAATLSPGPAIGPAGSCRLEGAAGDDRAGPRGAAVGARGTRTNGRGSTVCCRSERD